MHDGLVILLRFLVVYGGAWYLASRALQRSDVFATAGLTVVIAHFAAYVSFLLHFLSGFSYTPASSLFAYGLTLSVVDVLLRDAASPRTFPEPLRDKEHRRTVVIWAIFLLYFLVLFLTSSYRIGHAGANFHAALDLWEFNRNTGLVYPDLDSIGYSFKTSPLYFHPLFFTNALLLTSGVSGLDAAVTGFALVHFLSVMGMMVFIHLLIRELTGDASLSFAALILFATWRPGAGYSFLFMPDYNSFVGIFTAASLYYLIRAWRRFSFRDSWLFLLCAVLGVNNRIWLAAPMLGFCLVFALPISRSLWVERSTLRNWKHAVLLLLTLTVGSYWSLAVFGVGASGSPLGVYQTVLEEGYGAGAVPAFYSVGRLITGAVQISSAALGSVRTYYFKAFTGSYAGAVYLPGYISVIALLGMGYAVWRLRERGPIALLLGGTAAGLYLTAFISPPLYPRGYLWLIPVFLLFATLAANELYRWLAERLSFPDQGRLAVGVALGVYLNVCGFLYVTDNADRLRERWGYELAPGVYPFYQDVNSLVFFRQDIQRMARELTGSWDRGGRILHLIVEPGLDLDAFLPDTYWWQNDYLFPGVLGNELMTLAFPGFETGAEVSPCSLLDLGTGVIDVPVRFDTLLATRNWTPAQARVLERLQGWLVEYPDVFEMTTQSPFSGRAIYLVHGQRLASSFDCRVS